MNGYVKIAIYLILATLVTVFALEFRSAKREAERRSAPVEETTSTPTLPPPPPGTNQTVETNQPAQATNLLAAISNQLVAATNLAMTNGGPALTQTNLPPETSNAVAAATNPPPRARRTMTAAGPVSDTGRGYGRVMSYLGLLLVSLILLGLMIARDIAEFIGSHSVEFLFNDEGKGITDPEYELAEHEWAQGNKLEAIQMMRDYFKKNPRDVFVPLRIAEIYEKDLNNFLAAALEYEEVLTYPLPPERWGWAAIHLCNIYSKMGKTDKTVALLRRIVAEYGETRAAEKASKRLAMYDAGGDTALSEDQSDLEGFVPRKSGPDLAQPPVNPPGSDLPPGFRPKKG